MSRRVPLKHIILLAVSRLLKRKGHNAKGIVDLDHCSFVYFDQIGPEVKAERVGRTTIVTAECTAFPDMTIRVTPRNRSQGMVCFQFGDMICEIGYRSGVEETLRRFGVE